VRVHYNRIYGAVQKTLERICWQDPPKRFKISEGKSRLERTFELWKDYFVISITNISMPDTGKDYDTAQ
jgi:hypothetical protein